MCWIIARLFRYFVINRPARNTALPRIRHCTARAHRAVIRLAGNRHQPAHALRYLIEPRALDIRATLAEARNAGENDFLVHLIQRFIINAKTELHIRAKSIAYVLDIGES